MVLSITKPIVGGDDGVWAPIADTALDTIVDYVNARETDLNNLALNVPTKSEMAAAIAAAIAQPILSF